MTSLRDLATRALELSEKATCGPWESIMRGGFPHFRMPCEKQRGDGWHTVEIDTCDGRSGYNTDLIAFSRTALPQLAEGYLFNESIKMDHVERYTRDADRIEKLEAKLAVAREALEIRNTCCCEGCSIRIRKALVEIDRE